MTGFRLCLTAIGDALLGAVLLLGPQANAADIKLGSGRCTVRLDGPIAEGDRQQLQGILKKLPAQKPASLCLNSPGGDYYEALDMIEDILAAKQDIETIVQRGSECYSACAFLFLSGHRGKTVATPYRRLDAKAVLGFHGPYIKPDTEQYDPRLVGEYYQAGIRAIGTLIALSQEQMFPQSLLALGLERGPEEFLIVETIDQIGRWHIDLIGYRPPTRLDERMVSQSCWNDMAWKSGMPGTAEETVPTTPISLRNQKYRVARDGFGDEAVWICVADVYDGKARGLFLDIQWVDSMKDKSLRPATALEATVNRNRSPVAPNKPLWYVFAPEVTLSSIAADTVE